MPLIRLFTNIMVLKEKYCGGISHSRVRILLFGWINIKGISCTQRHETYIYSILTLHMAIRVQKTDKHIIC